ncbi:MAG TPA: hypothetical protein PKD52_08800 [Clostridiales bacterium]|nr:hypothetical protein [Clostridiales bacterium]
MGMELSKKIIDEIKFTRRYRRCYDALEVDTILDEIAAAAEEQAQELQKLRAICDEYAQVQKHVAETLLMAQESAEELLTKTKQKCDEELAGLIEKKNGLRKEIDALEEYKLKEVERIRSDFAKLFGHTDREPKQKYTTVF